MNENNLITLNENSQEGIQKKAKEKIIRNVIKLLPIPRIGEIVDLILALDDAEKEQAIEDAIQTLLSFTDNLDQRMILVEEDMEVLKKIVLKNILDIKKLEENYSKKLNDLLVSKSFYNSLKLKELLKILVSEIAQTFENTNELLAGQKQTNDGIKSILELLKKRNPDLGLTANPHLAPSLEISEQDNNTITLLEDEFIKSINLLVDNNDIDIALNKIEEILTKELNPIFKTKLISTKGNIYIRIGDENKAKEIYEWLKLTGSETEIKYKFFIRYAAIISDEDLKTISLNKMKELGASNKILLNVEILYHSMRGEFDKVIELIIVDKSL